MRLASPIGVGILWNKGEGSMEGKEVGKRKVGKYLVIVLGIRAPYVRSEVWNSFSRKHLNVKSKSKSRVLKSTTFKAFILLVKPFGTIVLFEIFWAF